MALLIAVLAVDPVVASVELPYPPDPEGGRIGGRSSVALFPARYSGGTFDEVLPADGFVIHLVPADDPSVELTYPAATWFQPPEDRYRVWAEGAWEITPYTHRLIFAGRTLDGRSTARPIEVVAGGRVVLPADADASLDLRLLHADSYVKGGFLQRELSRWLPAGEVGDEGVLLPPGTAIGGLWDPGRERFVALSRPFEVSPRGFVELPLEPPQEAAHLIVSLQRPVRVRADDDYRITLSLLTADERWSPDHVVDTAISVHGVWYDVPPGQVELRVEGRQVGLAAQRLCLTAGGIESVTAKLQRRPDLEVGVAWTDQHLPAGNTPVPVRLLRADDGILVAERRAWPGRRERHRFEALPLAVLDVELGLPGGSIRSRVDLRSGADAEIELVAGRAAVPEPVPAPAVGAVRNAGAPPLAPCPPAPEPGTGADATAGSPPSRPAPAAELPG